MIIALDCETYKYDETTKTYKLEGGLDASNFQLGVVLIEGRTTPNFFTNREKMYQFLLNLTTKEAKRGHRCFIYAHNGIFDLASWGHDHLKETDVINIVQQRPLLAYFNRLELEEKDKNGKPIIRSRTSYLLDSMSFYHGKLEDLGKMLGIPKLEAPKEVKDITELKAYCLRDTEIVLKSITLLRDTMKKLGHRPNKILTAGNLAMTYFKTEIEKKHYNGKPYTSYLYRQGKIFPTHHHDFIRLALRGARVECFHSGNFKSITMLDANSLYGYILAHEIPMPDLDTEMRIRDPELLYEKEELLDKIGVAEATLRFPKTKLSYLPVRYEKKIFFPQNTEVQGFWTTFELRRAIEEGYELLKIHDIVIYKQLPFNPFTEIIDNLYKLRQESDPIMSHVIKLLINSLAGKFSQYKSEKIRKIIHRDDLEEWDKQGYTIASDDGEDYFIEKETEKKLSKNAHPIITMLTTAYARDFLYRHLKQIPFEDLLYCDTDSIAFLGDHKDKFKIGTGLGEWKIEYEDVEAEFVKEKTYKIKDKNGEVLKVVLSGSTIRDLSDEQIKGTDDIHNRKMYSYNMGYHTGHMEKVGTFFETKIRVNPEKRKRDMVFPEFYREFSP